MSARGEAPDLSPEQGGSACVLTNAGVADIAQGHDDFKRDVAVAGNGRNVPRTSPVVLVEPFEVRMPGVNTPQVLTSAVTFSAPAVANAAAGRISSAVRSALIQLVTLWMPLMVVGTSLTTEPTAAASGTVTVRPTTATVAILNVMSPPVVTAVSTHDEARSTKPA